MKKSLLAFEGWQSVLVPDNSNTNSPCFPHKIFILRIKSIYFSKLCKAQIENYKDIANFKDIVMIVIDDRNRSLDQCF